MCVCVCAENEEEKGNGLHLRIPSKRNFNVDKVMYCLVRCHKSTLF